MDDIIFYSAYFFLDMPIQEIGTVSKLEPDGSWFELRLALPERISIG
jgi:hypothetical protein